MEGQPFGENGVVTTFETFDESRSQSNAPFSCCIRDVTGAAQQPLHLARPLFFRKRPADRAFHVPLAHEIVCPLIGKLRGTHDERYGAFWS